jgi:NhaP-type Na+/H+ or K+/H+ antiporter
MSRGLAPVAVVCLIVVGIAIKATAARYGDTHPVVVMLALVGLIIGAVCIAYLATWLRRLMRRRDHLANRS